jgi:hypothetical protein
MIVLLQEEESNTERGGTGPCMEYLLQEKWGDSREKWETAERSGRQQGEVEDDREKWGNYKQE